jgi:hypothetical protein
MKMLFKCRRLLREFYNSDSHLYDLETKVLPRLLTSLSRKKDFNEQSGDDAMMTKKILFLCFERLVDNRSETRYDIFLGIGDKN